MSISLSRQFSAFFVTKTLGLLLIAVQFLWYSESMAQEHLFEIPEASIQAKSTSADSSKFTRKLIRGKLADEEYLLALPERTVRVKRSLLGQKALDISGSRVFSFQDAKGSLILKRRDGQLISATLHEADQQRYYQGHVNAQGELEFVERSIDSFHCVGYPRYVTAQAAHLLQPKTPNTVTDAPQSLSVGELQSLQSLPGSDKVLYLDYWGGTVSNTAWNDSFTGGAPINYQPFNITGSNVNTFSSTEKERIYIGWADMAEDFAPFNVNVTTSQAVFNAADEGKRAKIVVTPTITWFDPSGFAGGVAFVNVFGLDLASIGLPDDYYNIGWSWSQSAGNLGQTNSHEMGHILGLLHDGWDDGDLNDGNLSFGEQYYRGQGNWAPIMGSSINRDYIQWSKGDYANAMQYRFIRNLGVYEPLDSQQNDLAILQGKLGKLSDAAGGDNNTALPLDIGDTDMIGIITPQGMHTGAGNVADVDVYRLDQAAPSEVEVMVRPLFQGLGANTGSNLSMRATLSRSNGQVISEVGPNFNPNNNVLSFSGILVPGVYYLRVENESFNTSPSSGFPEYGNGGYYQLSVSGGFAATNPDVQAGGALLSTKSLEPGEGGTVQIFAAATNFGFDTATSYTVTFYRSDDATISDTDTVVEQLNVTADLANGQTNDSLAITFDAPLEAGTYRYGYCISDVDPPELNFDNNCSKATTLSVSDDFCLPIVTGNGKVVYICL